MRITIVSGCFRPLEPNAGGAMEKLWWRLAQEFLARGHVVTIVTRQTRDGLDDTRQDGVRILRVPGADHLHSLPRNLWRDLQWGLRVHHVLPAADILVTNTVALPLWVSRLRPEVGRLVVNLNRQPKGQLRWYGNVARVQAASRAVADAARRQAPRLDGRIRVAPNPIDYDVFARAARTRTRGAEPIVIGYHGRIHPEKGLNLLLAAATRLLDRDDLPLWRMEFRGPVDVARGGGGERYLSELLRDAERLREADHFFLHPPEFNSSRLARACADLDIFCYPSLAEKGEALGVAILEAMAARRPVVVTDLLCFRDYVHHGKTGLVLSGWKLSDAADRLEKLLVSLMEDPELRTRLGAAAQSAVEDLDYGSVAEAMLADFAELHDERR